MTKPGVFISYRRTEGAAMARLVYNTLKKRGLNPFLDVIDLGGGKFGPQLLREIKNRAAFVLILTPGSLERCVRKDDWLRQELVHAIGHNKKVIPITAPGFQWPPQVHPKEIAPLAQFQAVAYSHEHHEESMKKLETNYLLNSAHPDFQENRHRSTGRLCL